MPLRPARLTDRAALDALGAQVLDTGAEFPFERHEDFRAYWYATKAECWVAEDEGQILGSYVLKPVQPGRGAHVANAGYMVDPKARGRGLGRELADHSIERARALGYRAMQFNYVVATNEAAVRLWREVGFEIVARLPGAFRHEREGWTDVLVLWRAL